MNRGMRAIAVGFRRRGVGYVAVLTALVAITGAAGMYRFELDVPGGLGIADYGTALLDGNAADDDGIRLLAPDTRGTAPVLTAGGLRVRSVRVMSRPQ